MKIDPISYFENNIYTLEEQQLRSYNESKPSEGLIRFFNYLDDFVFGAAQVEMEEEKKILLFYAENKMEYKSISIPLPIEDYNLGNDITTILSRRVCEINSDKDFFNVFNTFQHQRQSVLEALGYLTFDPFTTPKGTILSVNQKLIPIQILNRIDVLKNLYSDIIDKPHLAENSKIYLMVDNRTGLIKIGKSKNPKYRERTLQSQEPQTHLICSWTAPASVEKELHEKYKKNRRRGEWFKLGFEELDEIKDFMNNL